MTQLRSVTSPRIGQRVVDVVARRPTGYIGRAMYRDPKSHEQSFAKVVEWLGPLQDDRCLEIGCGGGVLLERALAAGAAVVAGMDHSPDMLALSIARNAEAVADERLTLKLGDAAAIPWPADRFTAAFCANMFFFVDRPAAMLAEVARVLSPGGRLVIATVRGPLPRRSLANWWTFPPLGPALHVYTDQQMRDLYTAAGFIDVQVESTGGMQLSRGSLPTGS